LYVNGQLVQSTSATAVIRTSSQDLTIGTTKFNSSIEHETHGSLANVGIWNRALSASEIESIYWKGQYADLKGTELTNLVSWYNLKDTVLGSELVTNGDFASDSDWTKVNNVTIANGIATMSGDSGTADLKQTNPIPADKRSQIQFTILSSDVSSNTGLQLMSTYGIDVSQDDDGNYIKDVGTHTITGTSSSADQLFFRVTSGAGTLTLDDVSVKEVLAKDSTTTNNGSIYGATTLTDVYSASSPFLPRIQDKATPKGAVALASGSTSFATDDYINTGTTFSNTNHTISAWVNASATGGVVFDNRDANDDGIRLIYDSSLIYQLNSSDVSLSSPSLNTWHHIACTYDGTTQKLYLNGSLVASASTSQTVSVSQNLVFGKQSYSDVAYFDGSIANVAIYSDSKTQSQIQDIMFSSYSTLTSALKTNLVSWYDLGSTELGSDLVDADASTFEGTSTYSWSVYGNNTIQNISNQLVITYVDNASGCNNYFKNSSDLSSDLTVGAKYEVSVQAKYSGGSSGVGINVYTGSANIGANQLTTSMATYTWTLVPTSSTGAFIRMDSMSSNNVITLDNFSIKEIQATDSQGDNEGSIYGATTNTGYTNSPSGVADPLNYGEVYGGNAVSFDGSNDYISVADSSDLSFGDSSNDSEFSISAWINMDDATKFRIASKCAFDGSSLMEYTFTTSGSDALLLQLFDATTGNNIAGFGSTLTSSQGKWIHVACTYDASESASGIKIYVDGSDVTASTSTDGTYVAMHNTTAELEIGRLRSGSGTTSYSDGKINNVKIFNTALTQDQVRELYTKPELTLPTGIASSALKLDMPMQEGSGVAILDGSGNQNHGTGSGITWANGQEYGFQHPLVRSNNPMVFGGSDDQVDCGTNTLGINGNLTLSCWVRSDGDYSKYRTIIAQRNAGVSTNYEIYLRISSGVIGFFDGSLNNSSTTLTANTENHIMAVVSGTSLTLYLNGSSIHTATISAPSSTSGEHFVIGNAYNQSEQFDGMINDVAVWDSALTANEVTALYNSGLPLLPTADSGNYASADDLVGYWRNDGVTTWLDKANTGVASFDGGDDHLDVVGFGDIFGDNYAGNLTASTWVKINDTSQNQGILNFTTHSNSSGVISVFASANQLLYYLNGNGYRISNSFTSNDWNHIVAVYDTAGASGTKLYLNGSEIGSHAGTFPSDSDMDFAGLKLVIGSYYNPSLGLHGLMSGTNIFNTALSATEVSELYAIDKRSSISGFSQFSNCVGSWLMGAGTGDTTSTIQDQTSNNNDATVSGANLIGYNNGTVSGDPASIIVPEGLNEGRDSQGYYLTDTDSISSGIRFKGAEYISVQDSESLDFANAFTIETWIKPKQKNVYQVFLQKGTSTKSPRLNIAETNGRYTLDIVIGSSHNYVNSTNNAVILDQWQHLAVTWNGSTAKMYIDGSQNATASISGTQDLNTDALTIGKSSSDYFTGSLDEVRLYSKELSATEVLKNYNNGKSAHSN